MSARNDAGQLLWPYYKDGWEKRIAAFSRGGVLPDSVENIRLLAEWRKRWATAEAPISFEIVPSTAAAAWPWVLGTVALATAGYFAFPYLTGERKA